ncbi:MAG: prepilin-type N-terminal cleavage/methylation domain-containing protein [Elusimicrobia bacterium]|nr:prepilin-type N-terminal cleavage/methylation domain-containing protein [Elusimicrobiota bacterium]
MNISEFLIKKIKGFTLVELAITVAIIVILSSISVPIYKDYIGQAKKAEAYTLLAAVRDAQVAYFNQYGNFWYNNPGVAGTATPYDPVLNVDARTNKYYTWFVPGKGNNQEVKYQFKAAAKEPWPNYIFLIYNITSGVTWGLGSGNV